MRDFGATIRNIYTGLLSGLTYDGQSVVVYGSEPYVTTDDNYVVLTAVDATQKNNDQTFVSEAVVTIDIVTRQNMANDRSVADNISDQILQALLPNSYADQTDSLFRVQIIYAEGAGYLHESDGTISVNRKFLRIFNRIIQK